MVADRRPEAGDGVPLRVLAGGAPARDLALAERIAPVLDAQPAPGASVLGEGDVAGGVQPGSRSVRIAASTGTAPLAELEPGRGGELAAGATPVAITTTLPCARTEPGPDLERRHRGPRSRRPRAEG